MKTNLVLFSIVAIFTLSCNNSLTKERSFADGFKEISYFSEPNDSVNYYTEVYDNTGALRWRTEYQNGFMIKQVTHVPISDDIRSEVEQNKLGKQYEFLAYYPSGAIKAHTRTFEDETKLGWDRTYHKNGLLSTNISMKQGPHGPAYHGQFHEYFNNGALKLTGYYDYFEPDSIWSYYNQSGEFVKSITVKDGKQKTLQLGE